MFRVVTLGEVPDDQVARVVSALHVAYGVGSEHVGSQTIPKDVSQGDALDAVKLLAEVGGVQTFADDKIVYVTTRALAPRALPTGKAPTFGFSQFAGERAVVSSAGLGTGDVLIRRLGKHAVHEAGHTWHLHHCLDPRCSMHPPWTPAFVAGEAILCTFCRDKSEKKIQRG
jgi:archaemetzincin